MKNNSKEEIVRYQNTINSNYDDITEEKNNINIAYDFDDGLIDSQNNAQEQEQLPDTHRGLSDYDPFDDLVDHAIMKNNDNIVIKKEVMNDNNSNQVFKKKIVQNKTKAKNEAGLDNINKPFIFDLNQFKVDPYNQCNGNYADKDRDKEAIAQLKNRRLNNSNQLNTNTSSNEDYKYRSNECNCNKVIINNVNNNSNNNIIIQTPRIEKLGDDTFNANNLNNNAIYSHKNIKSDNYDYEYDKKCIDCDEEKNKDNRVNNNNGNKPNEEEEVKVKNNQVKMKQKAKGTFASLQIKSQLNKIENSKDIEHELSSQSNQITDFQKSLYTQQIPPQKKKQQNTLNHYASYVSPPYTTHPIDKEKNYFDPLSSQLNPDIEPITTVTATSKPKRRKSTDLPIMRNQTTLLHPIKMLSKDDDDDNVNIRDIDEDIEIKYLSKLSKLKQENEELKRENQSLIEKNEQKTRECISQKSSYDTLLFEYDIIVNKYEELKAKCKQDDNDKTDINQLKYELKTKGDKVIELNNKIEELESIINANEQRSIDDKTNLRETKLSHDSLKSSYLDIKNQFDVMTLKLQSLNDENFSLKRELILLKTSAHNINNDQSTNFNTSNSNSNNIQSSFNKNYSNFNSENQNACLMNMVREDNQSSTSRKKERKTQVYDSNNDDINDNQQYLIADRIKRKNTSQNDSSNVSSLLTCGNIGSRNEMPLTKYDTNVTQTQTQAQQLMTQSSQPTLPSQSQSSSSITGTFRKRKLNPSITSSNISIMPCQTELLQKESKINQLENEMFQLQSERTRHNDELNKLPEHPKHKAQILQKKNIELQIGELNVKINEYKKVLRELTKPIY